MKTPTYFFFKYSLLFLFLQSMFAWFFWGKFVAIIVSCVLATFFLGLSIQRSIYSFKKQSIISVFFLIIIELYVIRDQNENAFILALLRIIIISMLLLFNDTIKIDLFRFFTKSFAVLLSISLFAWILFLVSIPLPHFLTIFGNNQYVYDNYYLFLLNHVDKILPLPRFSSIFLEPGQLGMICLFFLCANSFEFKRKEILVIFIATLFTFSLAAYLLLAISLSFYFVIYTNKPIRNLIIWVLFLILFYFFFSTLNNGDNIIQNLIFERFGSDDGEIIKNNRFSQDMDLYFDDFLNSNNLLMGKGPIEYNKLFLGDNAGYKVFLIQHGIIGTFVVFLLYLSIVLKNKTKMAWVLFLVYILCFLQAAYPLWECELLLFITAIPFFKLNNPKVINEELKRI